MALEVTLEEMLGKGSYGMVYRGSTPRHGAVAVKVLPWAPHEVSSDLKRELKMLQRCNSAYIVRAFGAFAKPKELWICMEYCDLGSLLDVMRSMDEPLAEDAIAAALCDSLRGLVYMHTQKRVIIHRDIKSANILMNTEGRVKLADFGVAAQLNSTASKRSSVIGTPHWMAPEVIQNGKYDARADVWSLGITAIELAQCRPPHHDMRPVLKVLFAIASGNPPQLERPDAFSETFRDFIATALQKDTEERPTSSVLLKHPFLEAAERAPLLALAEKAKYFKEHPKSRRLSEQATLSRGESEATLQRDEGTLDGTIVPGGTFCEGGTAGGTFCEGGTAGGTFCAAGGSDGGTFCAAGGTAGGTFCAQGDTMGGTFCAQADTMGGTFCAQGDTMGGTFCASADASAGGTIKVGMGSAAVGAADRASMSMGSSKSYPASPGPRPAPSASDDVGTCGGSGEPSMARSLMRMTVRAMDDSQLDSLLMENHFDGPEAATEPSMTPGAIPRAASDDALFARAVSTFDSDMAPRSGKKIPARHAEGSVLPGKDHPPAPVLQHGVSSANNCAIS